MARKIVQSDNTFNKAIERLNNRKNTKQRSDEYYTPEPTVKAILDKLNPKFTENKVIYCPCDSIDSQFVQQIQKYRNILKYKQLLYTSDDFRTHKSLFDLADIVITNPPFSLSSVFVHTLIEHNCDFIIISIAVTAGRLAMENNIKYYRLNVETNEENKKIPMFICPEGIEPFKDSKGKIISCCGGNYDLLISSFNLLREEEVENYYRPPKNICLLKDYEEQNAPLEYCENFDYEGHKVLNVNNINDLPLDYNGYFALPCTSVGSKNEIVNNIDFMFEIRPKPVVNGKMKFSRWLSKWKDFDKNKKYYE